MKIEDTDSELDIFAVLAIGAAVYGTTNFAIQGANGEINNIWDRIKAFGSGLIAGGVLTAGIVAGLRKPALGTVIKTAGIVYGSVFAIGTVSEFCRGILGRDWRRLGNTWRIFAGNFYLDHNRNFFGQTCQGVSRFSWELPQSTLGHGYSQIRNVFGRVNEVRYLAGATFSIGKNTRASMGVSLGNHLNISLRAANIDILNDPLCMHEYGHTFQSQILGPLYLPVLGIPSIISAGTSRPIGKYLSSHSIRFYEMQTNRFAAGYFGRHCEVDWTEFDLRFPRRKP
jgi:hypothetical protein